MGRCSVIRSPASRGVALPIRFRGMDGTIQTEAVSARKSSRFPIGFPPERQSCEIPRQVSLFAAIHVHLSPRNVDVALDANGEDALRFCEVMRAAAPNPRTSNTLGIITVRTKGIEDGRFLVMDGERPVGAVALSILEKSAVAQSGRRASRCPRHGGGKGAPREGGSVAQRHGCSSARPVVSIGRAGLSISGSSPVRWGPGALERTLYLLLRNLRSRRLRRLESKGFESSPG